jgi:class 3 adenylate cyclase
MADREREVPGERRIRFRIGVNLGDVIAEEGDIFGDGVNVAAQLEGLAEPGGVFICSSPIRSTITFATGSLRRERGRADQVAEHYRQLQAFGISRCRGIAGRRCPDAGGRLGAERGDGVEEPAAVASEHRAEILEILRCQRRQRFPIDLVVAKGRQLALKAQTL